MQKCTSEDTVSELSIAACISLFCLNERVISEYPAPYLAFRHTEMLKDSFSVTDGKNFHIVISKLSYPVFNI